MPPRSPESRFDWKAFLVLCAIFLGLAFLWHTPWVYPLKLFVVLLHEASHGLAALATGGRIVSIVVLRQEGGLTETAGGVPWLVCSAGYLGSLLFGVAILLVSTRTRLSQGLALLLGAGAIAVAIAAMPVHDASGRVQFGFWFTAVCGLVLAALAFAPRVVVELVLRVIGVTSCLYAILDIKSDVLDRVHVESDATLLARMTGVPGVVWGALWIAISLAVTWHAAKWAVTKAAPEPVDSTAK